MVEIFADLEARQFERALVVWKDAIDVAKERQEALLAVDDHLAAIVFLGRIDVWNRHLEEDGFDEVAGADTIPDVAALKPRPGIEVTAFVVTKEILDPTMRRLKVDPERTFIKHHRLVISLGGFEFQVQGRIFLVSSFHSVLHIAYCRCMISCILE